nr:glycoside hydrolase [Pirellulaceae bacterium]
HRGHRPSDVALIYSDDRGVTWRRGDFVARNDQIVAGVKAVYPSETTAVELSDGSVLFNMRSESARQRRLVAVSPDGVSGWSGHRWDEALLDPVCMASLLRYDWPVDGRPGRILFSNPNNLERTMTRGNGQVIKPPNCDRKRLTIKMSPDDGQTWPVARVLEEGPAGYSALARSSDGTILCLYEAGIVTGMCDDRYVRLARFNLAWLTGKERSHESAIQQQVHPAQLPRSGRGRRDGHDRRGSREAAPGAPGLSLPGPRGRRLRRGGVRRRAGGRGRWCAAAGRRAWPRHWPRGGPG